MQVWYYDIPEGIYTTQQIIDMSAPTQTYNCVYQTFRRLKVESFRLNKTEVNYNKKNEKLWKWLGAAYYLKINRRD